MEKRGKKLSTQKCQGGWALFGFRADIMPIYQPQHAHVKVEIPLP